MQKGYRYEVVEPIGRKFDSEFRPELTPAEMLRLGVFGGKYMTDCGNEVARSWFKGAKLATGAADRSLNTSVWMLVSRSRTGVGRAGYTRPTRAAGSNGTAATTWVGDC